MANDLADRLCRATGLPAGSELGVRAGWQALLELARVQWPDVVFDDDKLIDPIGVHLEGADVATALASTHGADLALAAACVLGEPTALAAFDSVLVEVEAAGAAIRASQDVVAEVKQVLRVQLLVAKDGKPAGLAGYAGKGPLRGWIRITATRELIRHKKKQLRSAPIERSLDQALVVELDPALEALKSEYRSEFAVALREAIGDLSAEDRGLLRQQIVDAMSIDTIGAAFGVHRATAARWLNRARGALVAATHRRLAARLDLPVEQIESVIRLVSSQLTASVVRYLRDDE